MQNNGSRLGPQAKQVKPKSDERIVYGQKCTWWSRRIDAKRLRNHPVCPNCLGPLFEVPTEEAFWAAVQQFEDGGKGVARPHPGYVDFMVWMKRRCFRNVQLAAVAYESQTGTRIELDERDFQEPEASDGTSEG